MQSSTVKTFALKEVALCNISAFDSSYLWFLHQSDFQLQSN